MKVYIHQCESNNILGQPVAWIIKLFQGMYKRPKHQRYNHYAISVMNGANRVFFDSSFKGVNFWQEEVFYKKYDIVKTFEYDLGLTNKGFADWYNIHHQKGYGFFQLVGIAGRLLHFIKRNPFGQGSGRIICNELIILFLNRFVEKLVAPEYIDDMDLNDTADIIDRHVANSFCKIVYTRG